MGTRSGAYQMSCFSSLNSLGNLDPSVPLYLVRSAGKTALEVEEMLNKQSGLKAIGGFDMV
jgi:acetate kinase